MAHGRAFERATVLRELLEPTTIVALAEFVVFDTYAWKRLVY